MITALQQKFRNVAESTRLVLDDKKFKAKTLVDEFWDSLNPNLCLTRSFNKRLREAFLQVDINESDTVDRAELYAGILLLYHKM